MYGVEVLASETPEEESSSLTDIVPGSLSIRQMSA